MTEHTDKLKQHLMAIDATVTGFAARIPEVAREAIFKDVRGALAILVVAEINADHGIDRRELIPGTGGTLDATGITADELLVERADGSVEQDGTVAEPKYIATSSDHVWQRTDLDDGRDHFHFSREDDSMDPVSYGSEFAAAEALGVYVHHLHQSRSDAGTTTSDGSGTALPPADNAVKDAPAVEAGQPPADTATATEQAQIAPKPARKK